MGMHDEFETRSTRRGPSSGTVVVLALIFGLLAGFGGAILALKAAQTGKIAGILPPTSAASATSASRAFPPLVTTGGSADRFAEVADAMDESVVNVNTTAVQTDPFSLFFGRGAQEVKGLGTGVIISEDGYILTNFHVVGDAKTIDVTVMHKTGKKVYRATLAGGDKQQDLAVIKIDAKGLKSVHFGNSDALRPGEWVMAIGNPFGFEHTVSVGVVSALNRPLPVDDTVQLHHMIQTDAAINPGNSGGPLVNLQGEVVGINSAVYVGREGNGGPQANGIGFAIPSNHAVKVMERLRKGGKLPYIGIGYLAVTDEMRSKLHLPVKHGLFVTQTATSGPADKAGLKRGDVITSVDGEALRTDEALSDYLSTTDIGKKVTLKIVRWKDDKGVWEQKTIIVKTAPKPANFDRMLTQPQQTEQAPEAQENPQMELPFRLPF